MDIHKLLSLAIDKTVIDSYTEERDEVHAILIVVFENESYFNFYCAWRLESDEKVLASLIFDEHNLAEQNVNVGKLIGKKILSYELSKQNDIILHFDDNFVVKAFCNGEYETEETKKDFCTNWDFRSPSLDMAVTIADSFQQIYTRFESNDERIL